MIHCHKCQTENLPSLGICEDCGANLLPGEGIGDRLVYLIGGILGGVIAGVATYFMAKSEMELPGCLIASPATCALMTVGAPIAGLIAAVRKTPLYKRYADRARRHMELDTEQAIADFSKALETAPEKERAELLKARATLYEKQGLEEEAARDLLEYTSSEGAYQTGRAVTRIFGGDADVYADGVGMDERKRMVAEGKAKALGYCSKCGGVVELNPDLRCPDHPSKKAREVRFVVPSEVEATKTEVLEEAKKQLRTRRNVLIGVAVVFGIPLLCCGAAVATRNLYPSLFKATATPTLLATVAMPSPTQQPSLTPEPTIVLPTSTPISGADFRDASVLSRGWLEDGSFLVTLQVPNGVEGNYHALVGGNEFKCEILDEFADRLYCHGIGVKPGTEVQASWYLEGVEEAVFEAVFLVPTP